jgi:predicted RNase H-like nuclease (RuvC/YqgF family)
MSEQDSPSGRTEDNQDPSAVKNPRFPEITGEGEEGKTWAEYQASKNQRINLESPDVDAEASEASGMEDVAKALTDGEEVAKAKEAGETVQEIGERAIAAFDGFGPDTETVEKAAPGEREPILSREDIKAAHRRTNSPVKEAVRETKEEISKLREGLEEEREKRVATVEKAAEEDGPDAVERLERGTEDALAKIEALEERLGDGETAATESRKTVSKSSGPDMTTEDWETLAEALDDSLRDQMPV